MKADFEALEAKSMAEIDALMRTKRCQIARIGGLLDRLQAVFKLWVEAELKYWDSWGDGEQERVDGQKTTLASMEVDQKRLTEFLETGKQDREILVRKKEELEKYGKRTEEIRAQMDSIIRDIQESEARLNNAQQQYDELTIRINNMKASITSRLIEIRQNRATVESYRLQQTAYYEQRRATANETCNLKQPATKTLPAPKRVEK